MYVRLFIITIILSCIVILTIKTVDILDSSLEKDQIIKSYIGKRIVLKKDTLIIIDYSLIKSNYSLSNGQDVSFELVNNKIQIID